MAGLIPAHAGKTRLHYASRAMYRAHPRSRGENGGVPATAPVPEGSSPLTRGKPCDRAADRLPGGLIPAHAGNTDPRRARQDKGRAHPRSRGENPHSRARRAPRDGSSPLTRGKHGGELGVGRGGGLIPAHAGKTSRSLYMVDGGRAHPRSRGENDDGDRADQGARGSSPLTRGKHHRRDHAGRGPGLIPAHAGKTPPSGPCRARARAHPRSRGENDSGYQPEQVAEGSSPLTRGKPLIQARRIHAQGLIPAHAGKTSVSRPTIRYPEAHPRSRGENSDPGVPTHTTTGSSPLTRGKRLDRCVAQLTHGLIPAHAGKTLRSRRAGRRSRAHPRSRGENEVSVRRCSSGEGSSPLTRGKRATLSPVNTHPRLIPAHAGKTPSPHRSRTPWPAHPRSRGENR